MSGRLTLCSPFGKYSQTVARTLMDAKNFDWFVLFFFFVLLIYICKYIYRPLLRTTYVFAFNRSISAIIKLNVKFNGLARFLRLSFRGLAFAAIKNTNVVKFPIYRHIPTYLTTVSTSCCLLAFQHEAHPCVIITVLFRYASLSP